MPKGFQSTFGERLWAGAFDGIATGAVRIEQYEELTQLLLTYKGLNDGIVKKDLTALHNSSRRQESERRRLEDFFNHLLTDDHGISQSKEWRNLIWDLAIRDSSLVDICRQSSTKCCEGMRGVF